MQFESIEALSVPAGVLSRIRSEEKENGEVAVSDFLIHLQSARTLAHHSRGGGRLEVTPIPKKTRDSVGKLNRLPPKRNLGYYLELVKRSQHRKKNKSALRNTLRQVFQRRSTPKSLLKKLADFSARPRAARYLTEESCLSMIREQTGLEWKGRLAVSRHVPRTRTQLQASSPYQPSLRHGF